MLLATCQPCFSPCPHPAASLVASHLEWEWRVMGQRNEFSSPLSSLSTSILIQVQASAHGPLLTPVCPGTEANAPDVYLFSFLKLTFLSLIWAEKEGPCSPGHSCTRKLMRAVLGERKAFLMLLPCSSLMPSSLLRTSSWTLSWSRATCWGTEILP